MTCPSCARELPGEFPFCPFCGAALTGEAEQPGREERKTVSVLFADLVGFTARAEQLDPRGRARPARSLPRWRCTRWTDAVRAYVEGNFAAAADVLQQTGSKPEEAEAQLRAADRLVAEDRRAEADEQAQRALEFYRSVGASPYVRECELLLAATA